MTTNVACIAGGFVVCFPFVVMVRKVRGETARNIDRGLTKKTMRKGSSGKRVKRQRECFPSSSLKVCTDVRWTYAGVITKFPWIDRFSFPIGIFIYHSIPLLYVQSYQNFEKVMILFNQYCVKLF